MARPIHFEETFTVARPPEAVFDYLVDASKLAEWQTVKTSVEPLTDGPPREGTRIRERTKPPGAKEFEQVVELTDFDRPRHVRVHVVEGPYPVDGAWSFEPDGDGTRVHCAVDGELRGVMALLPGVTRRVMARQFAGYHRNLKRNLEAG